MLPTASFDESQWDDEINDAPAFEEAGKSEQESPGASTKTSPSPKKEKQTLFKGRVWVIEKDDIDTDMIFHNRHLTITDISEMGQFALGNLEGYENFASEAGKGDIILTGKNFGAGSSRQQAVDCFASLGISCIIAESFGAIYERNAINAAFPILSITGLEKLEAVTGDELSVNVRTGEISNLSKGKKIKAEGFSEVQMEIFQNGGLF
jgi:3-isopropylmalate dehydratase small subunit